MNNSSKVFSFTLLLLACACTSESEPLNTQSITEKEAPLSSTQKEASPRQTPLDEQPTRASETNPPTTFTCPEGTRLIPGGIFFVGNAAKTYEEEENPRFSTRVRSFCADITEVTAATYEECVKKGECSPSRGTNRTCNSVAKGRGDHPMNCVDYHQAESLCLSREMRLPTEIEWEYLGRGGPQMLRYPWGNDDPEGRNCWKSNQSCKVGSFKADSFGLFDVVGNVWEWTSSYFAPYPWPANEGRHRVYRGASWSRRFNKWLRPNLRNRLKESGSGSHLGMRCVSDGNEPCPYGKAQGGGCLFGVEEVECLGQKVWNGARCASAGATICPSGSKLVPGRGCVKPKQKGALNHKLDLSGITAKRSPNFDDDCMSHTPHKPHAYRLTGGGHLGRNEVGRQRGCKNRDVGVGWNSACCP